MVAPRDDKDLIILEADGFIDEVHGYGYPIKKALEKSDLSSTIVSLTDNASNLSEFTGKPMIISGGMTEVTANVSWIIEAKNQISDILQNNRDAKNESTTPLLGICFGAQLIAEAYSPGSVKYLDDPEIGVSRIRLEEKHPLFDGFPSEFDAYAFHYNQIKAKNLDVISSQQHMGYSFVQAFEVSGSYAYGVQFHPELTLNAMKRLLRTYRSLISGLGHDVDQINTEILDITENHRIFHNFYRIARQA